MKKWRCYICGEDLTNNYCLVSENKYTDRVFLICYKNICIQRVAKEYTIIKVKEL